jgi:hypothetical protein
MQYSSVSCVSILNASADFDEPQYTAHLLHDLQAYQE